MHTASTKLVMGRWILYAVSFACVLLFATIGLDVIGAKFLIKERIEKVFVYQNDIVMNARFYRREYGKVEWHVDKYCTYWAGLETYSAAAVDVNGGKRQEGCPIFIVRR